MLADCVEVTDPAREAAVEAVLQPYRHLVLLASPSDAKAAFGLANKCNIATLWLPSGWPRRPHRRARCSKCCASGDPPAWLPRQLDKLRRVSDVAKGMQLPAGQDWITPKGYLREHRGGRHIGTDERYFGASARASHLRDLQLERSQLNGGQRRAPARAQRTRTAPRRDAGAAAEARRGAGTRRAHGGSSPPLPKPCPRCSRPRRTVHSH